MKSKMITKTINGIELQLETSAPLFSPTCVDMGTLAMLSICELSAGDKLLDLGCGYGVVGIYAAKLIGAQNVVMTDSNPLAVTIATKNAVSNGVGEIHTAISDGFRDITEAGFTHILSNPPYHADFSVPKHFIEKGFNRLVIGGHMYMVTKRKDWYKNKLTAIFGGVQVHEIDGYFVFCAQKRSAHYSKASKKVGRR